MKVESLDIDNLKSFKVETNIELGMFNIFVGKNATGKSNMIEIAQILLHSQNTDQSNMHPYDENFAGVSKCGCQIKLEKEDIYDVIEGPTYSSLLQSNQSYDLDTLYQTD